jgi:hypothetical protein
MMQPDISDWSMLTTAVCAFNIDRWGSIADGHGDIAPCLFCLHACDPAWPQKGDQTARWRGLTAFVLADPETWRNPLDADQRADPFPRPVF